MSRVKNFKSSVAMILTKLGVDYNHPLMQNHKPKTLVPNKAPVTLVINPPINKPPVFRRAPQDLFRFQLGAEQAVSSNASQLQARQMNDLPARIGGIKARKYGI